MALAHAEAEFYQEQSDTKAPDDPQEWRWRVRARNGEIVATGESYGSQSDATRGFVAAVRAMVDAAEHATAGL